MWSADGSGLVVTDGSGRLGIRPIDGGPTVSGLPPLAPTIESSVYAADGTAIDHTDAVVSATDGVGHLTTWYAGELGSGTVADARYAADGHAVWMLLDQRTDGARVATLARADTPHEWHVVGTVDVGSGAGLTWISGIAPDDSAVALSFDATNGDPNAPLSDYLIRATDGKATPHDGNVIGFVPSDVVDSWP